MFAKLEKVRDGAHDGMGRITLLALDPMAEEFELDPDDVLMTHSTIRSMPMLQSIVYVQKRHRQITDVCIENCSPTRKLRNSRVNMPMASPAHTTLAVDAQPSLEVRPTCEVRFQLGQRKGRILLRTREAPTTRSTRSLTRSNPSGA